jgi:hypothetical protein
VLTKTFFLFFVFRDWDDDDIEDEEESYMLVLIFDTQTGSQISEHRFETSMDFEPRFESWTDQSWLVAVSYDICRRMSQPAKCNYVIAINIEENICKKLHLSKLTRCKNYNNELGAVDIKNGKMLLYDQNGYVYIIDLKSEALLFKIQIRYGEIRCPFFGKFGQKLRAVFGDKKTNAIR